MNSHQSLKPEQLMETRYINLHRNDRKNYYEQRLYIATKGIKQSLVKQ